MFDSLADSLSNIFSKFGKKGQLTSEDVDNVLREIRLSLLEADVALPAVKHLTQIVKEKATGLETIKDVDPAQQIVKIVHDELLDLLSHDDHAGETILDFSQNPAIFMTLGLQGSGKTTSAGKIAKFLKERQDKKIFLASLDNRRPAAQEQLKILGDSIQVDSLPIISGQSALDIAKRAIETAGKDYDVIILDTAGRMVADKELMDEIISVKSLVKPHEILLVADSLTGQDAVHTAKAFHDSVGITGIVLTRVDGDGRGGAALSMRHVTGKPIKFMGVGETIDALEEFHPERIASRILGMGDVVSLVEKAISNIDETQALSMMEKFKKGIFDYDDLLMQMDQMQNLGGMGGVMNLLPGMRQIKKQVEEANIDDGMIKRQKAIILSMTKKERKNPNLVNNASRKKRIATGSGTTIAEVNKLIQMQKQMAKMMTEMQKMQSGKGGMMGRIMKGLMGGGESDMNPANMPSESELKAMAQKMKFGGGLAGGGMPSLKGLAGMFGKKKDSNKPKKTRFR